MFHIVLVEPEIPQNTGNIARTCAVTGAMLHLVRPLGFSVDDRQLKRAGLDYWGELDVVYHDSFAEVEAAYPGARFFLLSTHAKRSYAEADYRDGDFLVFGKETAGLGPELLARRGEDAVRIPMREGLRSLNLSNSVALVLYEALRQAGFPQMT
ncbi:MAG: tRNA (cytidine(34)-2'-O)-methyltransferase [Clostridiales bacterium]|nr:tRNA (cytidine(34)-2'-O)-methyltransferase [Clostridiales bacterium]